MKKYFDSEPETFRNIKKSRIFKNFISRNLFKYRSKTLKDAGWHFSWIMTPERIAEKMSSISHTEYDLPHLNNKDHIIDALTNGKDIWNRDRKMVKQALATPHFPRYLVENADKFSSFIL